MHHAIWGLREAEGVAAQHLAALCAQLQGSKATWNEPAWSAPCSSCQKTFTQCRLRLLLSIQRLAVSRWEDGAISTGSETWTACKQAPGTSSFWPLQSCRLGVALASQAHSSVLRVVCRAKLQVGCCVLYRKDCVHP